MSWPSLREGPCEGSTGWFMASGGTEGTSGGHVLSPCTSRGVGVKHWALPGDLSLVPAIQGRGCDLTGREHGGGSRTPATCQLRLFRGALSFHLLDVCWNRHRRPGRGGSTSEAAPPSPKEPPSLREVSGVLRSEHAQALELPRLPAPRTETAASWPGDHSSALSAPPTCPGLSRSTPQRSGHFAGLPPNPHSHVSVKTQPNGPHPAWPHTVTPHTCGARPLPYGRQQGQITEYRHTRAQRRAAGLTPRPPARLAVSEARPALPHLRGSGGSGRSARRQGHTTPAAELGPKCRADRAGTILLPMTVSPRK